MTTGDKTALLEDLVSQRILLLDGAMGTMIVDDDIERDLKMLLVKRDEEI